MKEEYSSSLSLKRIIISLLVFCAIQPFAMALNRFADNKVLSNMFAINLAGMILIIYDWNLFGIHYNRAKHHLKETVLWSLLGIAVIGVWAYLAYRFVPFVQVLPDYTQIASYRFAWPAVILAYSYVQAAIINICFKCLTDHINVHSREAAVILLSGFLFGLFYTAVHVSLHMEVWIPAYFYNVVLIAFMAYLYNQSHSFVPAIISMGTVYLILQILSIAAL